jgi:hypothetical protein
MVSHKTARIGHVTQQVEALGGIGANGNRVPRVHEEIIALGPNRSARGFEREEVGVGVGDDDDFHRV